MNSITILWIIFWTLFAVISAIDLFVVTHTKSANGVKLALYWTGLWIGVALSFAVVIGLLHPGGATTAMQYVTGYLTEYSLSIDNLFVFIMTFALMGVEEVAQPKLIKLASIFRSRCASDSSSWDPLESTCRHASLSIL